MAQNTLPLPTGSLIEPKSLTPLEREVLSKLNWRPGDPVPADLPTILADAARPPGDNELPVGLDTPPLKPLQENLVDISKLSAAKQAELEQAIRQAAAQQEALRQQQAAMIPDAAPSVNQALAAAQGFAPIEDLSLPPAPATQPTTPTATTPTATTPTATTTRPVPTTVSETPVARAGLDHQTHCPQCSWELTQPVVAEPTRDDKLMFLQALLGHRRFYYDKRLLGGHIQVRFRSLTSLEVDAIYQQIAADVKAGKLEGQIGLAFAVSAYRMALSLDSVRFLGAGGGQVCNVPELGGDQTVESITTYVNSQALQAAALRNAVSSEYAKFSRLLERLEANADSPDFWQGIA